MSGSERRNPDDRGDEREPQGQDDAPGDPDDAAGDERDDRVGRGPREPPGPRGREPEGGPDWVERELPGFQDATDGHRDVPEGEVLAHEHALPDAEGGDFEPDVERIHRPIFREPRDPVEGREPAPWWVWAAAAVALFWGGWYLGRHGGRFDTDTHLAYPELDEYVEEEAVEQLRRAIADPIQAGQRIYTSRCQACHQADGRGVPGVFPPIVGSEWVTGEPEIPVLILLNGLQGPIEVAGRTYVGAMPAWRDVLSDAEIAAVATYIRQWETNEAPPVEPELVSALRAATEQRREPWTAAELTAAVEAGEFEAARP